MITVVPQTTGALACSTQAEAEALLRRTWAKFPSIKATLVHLEMFPRDLWFVATWNRVTGRLHGYVWEYTEIHAPHADAQIAGSVS